MVSKKRIDYGFNGFRVPVIPKGPRSARRRGVFKKANQDDEACAFELLALAGMLLQESESSASSNASEGNHQPAFGQGVIEQEKHDEVKPIITDNILRGSCGESQFRTEVAMKNCTQKSVLDANADCLQGCISANNNFDCRRKAGADVKSEICEWDNKFQHYSNRLVEAPENFRESCDVNVNNGFRQEKEANSSGFQGSNSADKSSMKNQLELNMSRTLIDSNSNAKSPLYRKSFSIASYSKHGNGNKLGVRDDDEKFLRCSKVCTKSKTFRSPQRIAHRRIRKHLFSRHWKVAPNLKDCELSRSEFADMGAQLLYRKRKICQSFERSEHKTRVKRRKFFDRVSGVTSDGGLSSESVSNSPEKGMDNPKDPHVKFSIKTIRIPELYFEVPETATIGSLKSTIMETVMTILGGGAHVGVLLQGKKVRDDNRTLVQTGISCKESLDNLSFELEPSSLLDSAAACVGDPPSQCETSQPAGSPETPVIDSEITDTLHEPSLLTNPGNLVESNHDSMTSPTDPTVDKESLDCRALVVVPASTDALAVVPFSQKSKRSECAQRRTRRPFSVTEVEALVRAVEELGTGRWRDVKFRAFENAEHRTYVDLKDKWKTLVHTAKISPQQRRGEPVPQELLDRVLAAHAYWSQHQAKQHGGKTLKITETSSAETEKPSIEAVVQSQPVNHL
ncbi:telomere repeat-binding protein 3 isoform X1 [Arachis hypogaea]|uniref:telomere repeat-binding protein 3 isoform X1 n=1 Tax=Arachis hypogaea TaxID=3818 RepID=UPI000DED0FAC|nr:telomere repeat-binding protein 3 isoform X1 [Arachis hypogaea]